MSSINLYRRIRELLPPPFLFIGTIAANNPDGTSIVTFPGGGTIVARNSGGSTIEVDHKAFVKDGVIQGEAPDLGDPVEIEI